MAVRSSLAGIPARSLLATASPPLGCPLTRPSLAHCRQGHRPHEHRLLAEPTLRAGLSLVPFFVAFFHRVDHPKQGKYGSVTAENH